MKKRSCTVTAAVVALFLMFAACRTTLSSEKEKYVFGFSTGLTSSINAQLKASISDVLRIITEKENIGFGTVYYPQVSDFDAAAKKGQVDFLLTESVSTFYHAYKNYDFKPFLTYSMYGNKMIKNCLYVKGDEYKTVESLKGKKVGLIASDYRYFFLREITGTPPEKLFKPVWLKDSSSPFYALSTNNADAVFSSDYAYAYLKITNPALVKGVREIACSKPLFIVPVLYKKGTPKKVMDAIANKMIGARTDKDLRKYHSLINMVKLEYFPMTEKDTAPGLERIGAAIKNGWKRDYDKWYAETGKEEE